MRAARIFISLTIACTFLSQAHANKKPTTDAGVREQFDEHISNLKKSLEKQKQFEKRWEVLKKTEKSLENLRASKPLQSDEDEIFMDMVLLSLKQIPRAQEFKKNECPRYRTHILAGFDPQGLDRPIPPIAETLSILTLLCR